jgi:insertion element IS1 protein InsB
MKCNYCPGLCIRKGWYKETQKYQCKTCKKYQRSVYTYQKYDCQVDAQIITLNNEGLGISSIGRVLRIPKITIVRRILKLSSNISRPILNERGQAYEVDELHTFIGKSAPSCYTYIIYAINRANKKIVDFVTGPRTKENVGRLINKLLTHSPARIYTDKLNIFPALIPRNIHRTYQYQTNRIERKNLTLRTHLKRLSRKTICYSKSAVMLAATLRLYIWS